MQSTTTPRTCHRDVAATDIQHLSTAVHDITGHGLQTYRHLSKYSYVNLPIIQAHNNGSRDRDATSFLSVDISIYTHTDDFETLTLIKGHFTQDMTWRVVTEFGFQNTLNNKIPIRCYTSYTVDFFYLRIY